jgi:hypothetical protein
MANLINLNAESGADYIADEATPGVTFSNSSTGPGLQVRGLVTTSTASIDVANLPRINTSSATGGLLVTRTVVGNLSIGVLRLQGNSIASGTMIEFTNNGFISITSTVLTTVANTDYAIPIQVGLETRYLPLFKSAAIVGAAAVS